MLKVVIFDIDNTLAKPNKPIDAQIVKSLKKIETSGIKIALISGKPAAYITGLARQTGLQNPIISGENGAYIYYSSNFPPQKEIATMPVEEEAKTLEDLKIRIIKKFDNKVWMQPNIVNLTIFPKTKKMKDDLFRYISTYASSVKSFSKKLKIYTHTDSIEVIPLRINKGAALRKIKKIEKLKKEEILAVGDNENDIPMFREAGVSIGINLSSAGYTCSSIKEAFQLIEEIIRKRG